MILVALSTTLLFVPASILTLSMRRRIFRARAAAHVAIREELEARLDRINLRPQIA